MSVLRGSIQQFNSVSISQGTNSPSQHTIRNFRHWPLRIKIILSAREAKSLTHMWSRANYIAFQSSYTNQSQLGAPPGAIEQDSISLNKFLTVRLKRSSNFVDHDKVLINDNNCSNKSRKPTVIMVLTLHLSFSFTKRILLSSTPNCLQTTRKPFTQINASPNYHSLLNLN